MDFGDAIFGFFGVMIGAIVGYLGSLSIWRKEVKLRKTNISKGFLSEILRLEEYLQIINDDKFLENHENISPDLLIPSLVQHALDDLSFDNPFYSQFGLFFSSRNDLYNLDEETYSKLEQFYSCQLHTETCRKSFIKLLDKKPTDHRIIDEYKKTTDSAKKAYSFIPLIKTDLQNKKGRSDVDQSTNNSDKKEEIAIPVDISFGGFLKNSDWLFTIWGIMIATFAFLSTSYSEFQKEFNSLLKPIMANSSDISNENITQTLELLQKSTFNTVIFGLATTVLFIIIVLVSYVIVVKWFTYIQYYINRYQDFYKSIDYYEYLVFFTFFVAFLGILGYYIVFTFSANLNQLISLLILIGVTFSAAFVLSRQKRK